MAEKETLTSEKHKGQIDRYRSEQTRYQTYATVLKRVLENACKISFPEAFVQSRPKSVSSFAEKAARKFDKYPDAVNQMTDLCGARVIVQTLEQVEAVKLFVEANFRIHEKDEKGVMLGEDKFGYRDMHYIIELRPDRNDALGITAQEYDAIGNRKAELQVRTWLQHAWADTLHDRLYKTPLRLSSEIKRAGNLLAALMEEGDRNYNGMANELDGMIANYTAYATKEDVLKEIEIQDLILNNEQDYCKKPALALKLGRLLAACGDFKQVVEVLEPHQDVRDANRCELLQLLGSALCRLHRGAPLSAEYGRGRGCLEESLRLCESKDVPFVPHLRNRESMHARALARLGWALERIPDELHKARDYYQQAHEHEPSNPFYLADMLGFELHSKHTANLPATMRTTIREAVKTCCNLALAGIELPYAYFTAGRLSVLLENADEASGYYARGIRHCLAGTHCVPADMLSHESDWLKYIHYGEKPPADCQRIIDLLSLSQAMGAGVVRSGIKTPLTRPILIIAGGAASIDAATVDTIRPLVRAALTDFHGTVIAGGTTAGIPGCVGNVAGELANENKKRFQIIGYLPNRLPVGVRFHDAYDEEASVKIGDDFSPEQILRNWSDILAAGVDPREVLLLGFGGGLLSAVEYRIALGLGACVGIVAGTSGAADHLLHDPVWSGLPNLFPLPFDPATVRAFVIPCKREFKDDIQEAMAQSFHRQYVAGSSSRLPASMRPWQELDETFKKANVEQAKYSVEILEAAGFRVREVEGPPTVFTGFTDKQVEDMAEMEHGRWNVERLRDGWRYGTPRDDSRKIHNCLVSWSKLPEATKHYDRDAVRKFPKILVQAKLEIYRP